MMAAAQGKFTDPHISRPLTSDDKKCPKFSDLYAEYTVFACNLFDT